MFFFVDLFLKVMTEFNLAFAVFRGGYSKPRIVDVLWLRIVLL